MLECAVTGRAQAIVTGDRSLLGLYVLRGVRRLSLRDYLDDRTGLTPPRMVLARHAGPGLPR